MNRCKLIGVSQDSKRLHKDTNSDIRCVVPLRKESIRSYLLILFSKSKSNNTNESQQVVSIATGVISLIQVLTT